MKQTLNFCASCGKPATPDTAFCPHCATPLAASPVVVTMPPAPTPSVWLDVGGLDRETLLLRDMTPNQQMYFMSEMGKIRKNPSTAFWWAFWLGGVGAQHFYLDNIRRGVIYLCFFWTSVPVIVSFFELFTIKRKVRDMNEQAAIQVAERVSTCTEPTVHRSAPGLGLPIQVLLVEDDPYAAAYISAQVSQDPGDIFQVEWKNNILNAVSRLAKPGIDVVLLDLGMPELGGYKTHLAITSAVGKTVPVVILTGDDSAVSQDITKVQGAANYLIKQRTSSIELRRAIYEAVVPVTASKAASDGGLVARR